MGAIRALAPGTDGGATAQDPTAKTGGELAAAIHATASALGATLVIMLDQFEEHFSYRRRDGSGVIVEQADPVHGVGKPLLGRPGVGHGLRWAALPEQAGGAIRAKLRGVSTRAAQPTRA